MSFKYFVLAPFDFFIGHNLKPWLIDMTTKLVQSTHLLFGALICIISTAAGSVEADESSWSHDVLYSMAAASGSTGFTVSPVDCVVGPWSDFGTCSGQCGGGVGVIMRFREILTLSADGGLACPELSQSTSCTNNDACLSDVERGEIRDNSGSILSNIVNLGTINGGRLAGTIVNVGEISEVTLEDGGEIRGGRITGTLSASGNATISNAILDVTALGNGIILGAGCRLTEDAVRYLAGFDLSGIVTGTNNILDVEIPLLLDENENELTVVNLLEEIVKSVLEDSQAAAEIEGGGGLRFHAPILGNAFVVGKPATVITAAAGEADGITYNSTGGFRFVSKGIAVTMVPASYESSSFDGEMSRLGITYTTDTDGVMTVSQGNGTRLSARFNFFTTKPDNGNGNSALLLSSEGDPTDHLNFHYLVTYSDGTMQKILPAVHDMAAFSTALQQARVSSTIASETGYIAVNDINGNEIFRFIADYVLEEVPSDVAGVSILPAGDQNGDGLTDYSLITSAGKQLLYSIPIQ